MRLGTRTTHHLSQDSPTDQISLSPVASDHGLAHDDKPKLAHAYDSAPALDDVRPGEVLELPLQDSDQDHTGRDSLEADFLGLEISAPRGRRLVPHGPPSPPQSPSGHVRQRSRAHSESARNNYDPQTGEPVFRRHPAIAPQVYRRGEGRWPLLQITVDELASESLRSDSSAMAISPLDGSTAPSSLSKQTIPEHDILDTGISSLPIAAAAGARLSGRRDSPSPRRGNLQRSASTIMAGFPTGRQPRRRTSTRSNSSSESAASTFLAHWSGATNGKPAPSAPDAEGQTFGSDGQYTLGRQIGFGGFSVVREVSKSVQSGTDKPQTTVVAAKILRKSAAGKDEHDNERFQRDVEHNVCIWRRLDHQNILPLLDHVETPWATICIMPLITGGTLLDLMHRHRNASPSGQKESSGMPAPLIKKYLRQLAAAVSYLHQQVQIVHGDIKPENCLLDDKDDLLLCDFGMAEFIDAEARDCSAPQERPSSSSSNSDSDSDSDDARPLSGMGPSETSTCITGSLSTASPELIRASRPLHRPSVDMWAFGVVSYSLMVGRAPFKHSFAPKLQMMILRGEFERDAVYEAMQAKQLCQDDVEAASELVNHCMDLDPRRRWAISQLEASSFLQVPATS